jgi:cytochrome c biogenesis protein CcdA
VIDAPLALAFGTGMVATVNPCGFAMLPAYLSFFLGAEGASKDTRATVQRSLAVGLSVSLGFLTVFGAVGLAIYHLSASVDRWTPWATLVIGVLLIVLGLAMLKGWEPILNLPKLNRGGKQRTGGSMFLFGVSYAIASISCALPLFTSAVAGTFRRADLLSSVAVFVAYSLGMTLVLLALTVSLGMAKQGLVRWLRKALPHINRVSGVLLILAGAYLTHYGWYEQRVRNGHLGRSSVVDRVTGWSDSVRSWIDDIGPTRLGLLLALGLLFVLVATFGLRGSGSGSRDRSR